MAVLDSILGKKSSGGGIPPGATFALTERGRAKLQEFSGDPKSRILVALEGSDSKDIDELAQASGLRKGQTEQYVKQLTRAGYLQYVGGMGADQ